MSGEPADNAQKNKRLRVETIEGELKSDRHGMRVMFVLRIEPVEQCRFFLSPQPLVIPNGIASKGAIQVSAGLLNRDGQSSSTAKASASSISVAVILLPLALRSSSNRCCPLWTRHRAEVSPYRLPNPKFEK